MRASGYMQLNRACVTGKPIARILVGASVVDLRNSTRFMSLPSSITTRLITVMGRLENEVCLITGGGGSMGRAAAPWFAREGAYVVGCDVNPGMRQRHRFGRGCAGRF